MLEYYDECPYSPEEQQERLAAARALAEAGMHCMVYGEDALAFIHFVPTCLFALHLVVADHDVARACDEIMRVLPFRLSTGVVDGYCERIFRDPARSQIYPNSTYLSWTGPPLRGDMVIVHPQKQLNTDIADYTRSVPFPPFPDTIRFPTRTAFLDSLIETHLDPALGYLSSTASDFLTTYISYLLVYTLRTHPAVLPDGTLEPERAAVMQSVRPENRPMLDFFVRGMPNTANNLTYSEYVQMRRDILRTIGKGDLANRPLPRRPPGNPEYRAKKRAIKAAQEAAANTPPPVALPPGSQRKYSTLAMRSAYSSISRLARFIR